MGETADAVSKHSKYQTGNPISRRLVANFLGTLERLVTTLSPTSVLDVGCGEGLVLRHLQPHIGSIPCKALDLDPVEVADAERNLPFCDVQVASAYEIPFEPESFDLVMCCEVLEHLDDPARALAEVRRVAAHHVIISVPREPLWRALNMVRGAYWSGWGNTPDHVNHWRAGEFESFIGSKFTVLERVNPLPWTVILARKR